MLTIFTIFTFTIFTLLTGFALLSLTIPRSRRPMLGRAQFVICVLLITQVSLPARPTQAQPSYADYEVVSVKELDLVAGPGSTHAHLAPDGTRFLYRQDNEVCMYTIAGVQQWCSVLPRTVRIDAESMMWSPGGKRLVFNTDFLVTFRNPGLWLVDAASGEVKRLTGVDRPVNILRDDIEAIDIAPGWIDDQTIIFFRHSQKNRERLGPYLTTLDVLSGKITRLTDLGGGVFTKYSSTVVDGNLMAYGDDGRGIAAIGGLWVLKLDELKPRRVFEIEKPEQMPRVIRFSADRRFILTWDHTDGEFTPPTDPALSWVKVTALDGPTTGQPMLVDAQRFVRRAGWSPQGAALVYAVRDSLRPEIEGLYLTTTPGDPGRLILPGMFIVPTSREGQAFVWATNDVLLVSAGPRFRLNVIQLGQK
jgi:hypothetical protein